MAGFGSLHIQFSDCEIDVAAFELRRGGQPCAVEPQVFELLLYLARNPDRLVTKSDLIENVWGGRIVSDSTLASRIKSARRAIGDDGEQQKLIRTVHGRGVRFIGDVRLEPPPMSEPANDASREPQITSPSHRAQPRVVIAVLNFANTGADAGQEYFADGLTQDIITDLGRFRLLDVVARNRSSRFRRQGADIKQIGRELGAGYIVTGSLQRRGARMKVAAELFDAASGHQLWAERFDRRAEDIFAVADDLVRTIAATLAGRVQAIGSAQAKRKPPANLAAYECVLRAQAASMRVGDPAAEAELRRFYEQAVSLDPAYGRAHAGMAMTLMRDWFRAPTASDEILELAFEHAQKAVALDRNDSECQETLGWILLHRRSYDAAEESYRRALELNPNSPDELSAMGAVCNFLGRPEEGLDWLQRAKQRDPHFDPSWYWHLLGATLFNARRYDEAIASFGRSPSLPAWAQAYLAACHAQGGQAERAQELSAKLLEATPEFSAARMLTKEPYRQTADQAHLLEGLRKAGLLPADATLPGAARPAIAVLPFANISGDPEQDYFADGLTEDIIADLAELSALYVTPRSSSFAYKGESVDIQQTAKDLDVCYLLDGSVRRMGDQVRIATQLVDGRTGLHVWAERYDRPWEDIFSLRDEIAQGIVAALQLQLLPQEIAAARRPATTSAEAYQYYLMGRSFFLKGVWAKRALEVARQLFAKAIEIDPNYARAYAGVANCDSYRLLLDVPSATLEDILANSERAIALEPNLAEAHAAKGLALYTSGRPVEASAAFEEAVRLGPDLYEAHFFYARHCRTQGLHAKAARLFERAAELNSGDFRALGLVVDEYRALNRHDDAMAAARRCLDRLEFELAAQPDNACALAFGAIIQAEVGDAGRAEEWASRAILIEPDDVVTSYNLACTYAALGKLDAAVDWLKRAFPETPTSRRAFVDWMEYDTALWPLHGHEEFEALLRRFRIETDAVAPTSGGAHRPSIAVLPFVNISGDPDQDYFADGLTEDIITDLSRVSALSVVARNSVLAYKGKVVDILQIARELKVDYLLVGSVRGTEDRVRITGQLIDGRTGLHVWAERYDHAWEDIFALQDEMSQSIVGALKLKLLPQEIAAVTSRPTGSPEGYQHYLMGRSLFLHSGRDTRALRVARGEFGKAIETDARYARAYAGIANCDSYRLCMGDTGVSFDEVLANSERALALDPELPEALAAKGLALHVAGRYREADGVLELAMRNGPDLFEAHYFAGRNHQAQGRFEQAAACFEKAAELHPGDFLALGVAVATYRSLGREDEMRSAGQRSLERLEAVITGHGDNAGALAFGASVQADVGDKAVAEAWADRAAALDTGNTVVNYNLACTYGALGRFDTAISHLQRVFGPAAGRRVNFGWLKRDSSLQPLHGHPEFQALVSRLQLESDEVAPAIAESRSPAIAVMPFENRSSAPDQLYFADGVVEQITAALARVRSFPVIARSSTVRYRGLAIDPPAVAKELGVRYLLEGSVCRSEDRIRIITQLVDADSGVQIWAERYDGRIEDIFDLQDRITESVVAAIAPTIRAAEIRRARRKRPQNLEAYDYVMRALPHVWALTSTDCAEALRLTTEAIRLDPDYGLANALAAWCHAWQFGNHWTAAPERACREGLDLARAALKLDPEDPTVLTMAGGAIMSLAQDLETADELTDRALRLDPNSAWAWIRSGYGYAYRGDAEAALTHFERAQRLSPFDPFNFNLYVGFAVANFVAARYEQACEWAERGLRERPDLPWAYRVLAAAHPYLGNVERSLWAAARLRELNPQISVAAIMAVLPLRPAEARARFAEGLRRAGLPEDSPAVAAVAATEPSPRSSAEAYQCYLRGRAFLLKGVWGKRALEVARQQFAKAIALDPQYALAYAAMASLDCYRLLLGLPDASFDAIAANSARALALGPNLPEAHAAIGLAHATAGRRDEANVAFEQAVALGPESFEAHFFSARHCLTEGQYDRAAPLFERAALLNADDFGALGLLVDVYRALGRRDDSMRAAQRCIDRLEAEVSAHPDNGCALAFGAIIQAEAGNESLAEEWANRAISIEPENVVTNYNLACAFGALGKIDIAMDWLRRAIPDSLAGRRALVEWMQHDSSLEPLRGHPAFEALAGRLREEPDDAERETPADLVKA
jgi:TolB-like protein/Tfp pilus assembly protein PilF